MIGCVSKAQCLFLEKLLIVLFLVPGDQQLFFFAPLKAGLW